MIIPTYQDWSGLVKCLIALEEQTLDRTQYEVIVINNNETSQLPEGVKLPENVRLIHESQPGSYVARNRGVAIAEGDILAFTDSDCIPDKYWLANALKRFEESTCDLIGGRVKIIRNNEKNRYGYIYERLTAFQQHRNVPLGKGVTANLLVRKSVFEAVNGFDNKIISGGDWDFTLRCTQQGYKMIYAEEVVVLHPARNLVNIFKKHYRITCGGLINARKKYGYSKIRILGSHLLNGLKVKREHLDKGLTISQRLIIFFIDLSKYLYRIIIYGGIILRLIDPHKIRE